MKGWSVTGMEEILLVFRVDAEGVLDVPGRTSLGIAGDGRRSSV